MSNSLKDGAEIAGVKIVTNAKPAKATRLRERLMPTIELMALARRYPSTEILTLVEETIAYSKGFGCEGFERELLRSPELKPTLNWSLMESKDLRIDQRWPPLLIYLYAKDLKKQLSGADLSDANGQQVSEPKATVMPSPKFKGRSVDEWLSLLQVEQSAEGQSDAFVGLTGLFNETDSPRILTATLENLRTKRGVGDERAVATKLENGFALLRLCAGAGYGKLLADELNHFDREWSNRVLNKLCFRKGEWLPEHDFVLKWLADPKHETVVPTSTFLHGILADRSLPKPIIDTCFEVAKQRYGDEPVLFSAFLYEILADLSLPQPVLETCFEVARQQYGDEFFLLRPIGDPKTGYSLMTPRIIDLAIATLENEASEPKRVALAASLLIEITSSISVEKMESVACCVERRLLELAKDEKRLTAITGLSKYQTVSVWSNGDWQFHNFMCKPHFAKNSEAIVLLSLIYHLGSPASSKLAIQEVIRATAEDRVRCDDVLMDKEIAVGLNLTWPSGKEQLEQKSDEIKKLSPEIWRAACTNALARMILESIENRMANEAQTKDPGVLAQLPQAYRDFAKWNNLGLGDMTVPTIKGLEGQVHQRKREFGLLTKMRSVDRDKNMRISILEYAQSLAELANAESVPNGSASSQPK